MTVSALPLLLLLTLAVTFNFASAAAVPSAIALRFADVTTPAHLPSPSWRRLKYGGAFVGDVDGDGRPDLVLLHHNQCCLTIHFNDGSSGVVAFKQAPHTESRDIHSVAMVHTSPFFPYSLLVVSVGGSSATHPKPAFVLRVGHGDRSVTRVDDLPQLSAGRGRAVLFVRLRSGPGSTTTSSSMFMFTDAIVMNAPMNVRVSPNDHAFIQGGANGRFYARSKHLMRKTDFAKDPNSFAAVTDVNGDGVVEVVTFQSLRFYQLMRAFVLRDVTRIVMRTSRNTDSSNNSQGELLGVAAVAELDIDNDGRWDLYLARSVTGDLRWVGRYIQRKTLPDILLHNVGGERTRTRTKRKTNTNVINNNQHYYNIVPQNSLGRSNSRGVTAADFDNDGYTDVYVSLQDRHYDVILFNDRHGGFHRPVAFSRRCGHHVPGDMATAADFDGDGFVDLLVSCGDWHDKNRRGAFRLYRNLGCKACGNSIAVRVGHSPSRRCTPLHATVRVKVRGIRGVIMRRVGAPGTATSNAVVDSLTIGIGQARKIEWIVVQWASGERRGMGSIRAMSSVFIGLRTRTRTRRKVTRRRRLT